MANYEAYFCAQNNQYLIILVTKLRSGVILLQLQDDFLRHLLVNVAVAAERAGVLDVAGDLGDEVGVFDFLIKIADQDATGHVGRGNFPDGMLLFLAGDGVQRGHHPVDAGELDHLLDVAVVVLLTNKGKKTPVGLVLVALQDLFCCGRERDSDRIGTPFLGFAGNVLDGPIDNVILGQLHQVTNTASDEALEYEDVALDIQPGVVRKFCLVQLVPFFLGKIEGSAIDGRADNIIIIGISIQVTSLDRPTDEGVEPRHRTNDGILAALFREPALRDRFICFLIEWILDARFSVLTFHNELVFILQELGELPEQIRGQRSEAYLLRAIDGEAFEGTDDDIVMPDPGDGDLLDGHEMLERVEEFLLQITLLFFRCVLLDIFSRRNVQFLNCPIEQLIRNPLVG